MFKSDSCPKFEGPCVDLFHGLFERNVPDAETRLVDNLGFNVQVL